MPLVQHQVVEFRVLTKNPSNSTSSEILGKRFWGHVDNYVVAEASGFNRFQHA
jgi:hypothetical protein